MGRILVTGASGQIGSELVPALRERHGANQVIASDVREVAGRRVLSEGPFQYVDCTDARELQDVVRRYDVDVIYHLAALLSAVAEEKPQAAWTVNMNGLYS
ncbi:MAG: NAD-dependent epimerase/dehydratase family protein, partial [Geminicoccaceae bacterium]